MSKWIDRFREKKGRRGLVPWLSFTIQKCVLAGVLCMATLQTISLVASREYFPVGLIYAGIAIATLYVGLKTKWLNGIDQASKPVRIAGAIIIFVGVLAVIVYVAIAVFFIIVGIFALIALFSYFLGGGYGTIKQDGKTYHQNLSGEWAAEKDWLGNDKVQRDWLGNPKIERDWLGNQKIARDWNGDPVIPSEN